MISMRWHDVCNYLAVVCIFCVVVPHIVIAKYHPKLVVDEISFGEAMQIVLENHPVVCIFSMLYLILLGYSIFLGGEYSEEIKG